MTSKLILFYGASALCLMAMTHPANAQTAAPQKSEATADSGRLEDIVVTARRVSENLQTVPVSVTAYTAKDLVERGTHTIEGLALGTPSISVTPATSTKNAAVISIRGQVQTDNLITVDPSVGVYIDDIYYARAHAALGDLLDVSGVEVLKGPQGTLYGRNTIGGAIKIDTVRADPAVPLGGYFRASYGNFNAFELVGAINVPVIKDKLALRYAASYRRHDGYTHSYLVPIDAATGVATSLTPVRKIDTDDQDSFSQRLSLRFTPTERFTLDIAGSTFHSSDKGVMNVGLNGDIQSYSFDATPASFTTSPQRKADFYSALSDIAPYSVTTVKTANSTIEWRFSDAVTAKLIAGYVESTNRVGLNSDGTIVSGLGYLSFQTELNQHQSQYSTEFQLLGKLLDEKLSYVAGLYYFDEKGYERAPNSLFYSFNSNISTNYQGSAHNQSKSAFADLQYSWTDRLRTTGGLRYTSDTKEFDGGSRYNNLGNPGICIYAPGQNTVTSTVPGGPCNFNANNKFNYLTYEVGSDYRITPNIFLYAKVGNGYRSGGQQLRGVGGASLVAFTPDKVMNYEGGIKSELLDRHVRLNLAYYHTDYSNIQQVTAGLVTNSLGSPVIAAYVINSGSAKIDGVEAEAVLRVGHGLSLSGNVGYTDFRFSDPDHIQSETPKWTYSVTGEFAQPTSLGQFSARLSYAGKSSFYFPTNTSASVPQSRLPGYGLLDGRLAFVLDNGIGLAVFGKNLLAKEYYSNGIITAYNPGPSFGFYGVRGMNIGAPRTFGVEASYKF